MISLELLQKLTSIQPENISYEKQNEDYEGMTFTINNQLFRSRLAKKTPTKKGYFVVFWEKDEDNINQPFLFDDSPQETLVFISDNEKRGVFKFPKEILLKKGILKGDKSKGKMGIRVYPEWESDLNQTAVKTQQWQLDYFTFLS
ncbi:MepB family protein [Vagococcus carniphilus]|uniref:MepB family protein n=1 Tax=Vagococcus carniphilus TaxID=218144 RepID=UPI002890B251|nr:MepB family protein [Vagococcus carniphilus]MDT2814385.1 MepB family protein [Vagococcus carniphilus]MDT2864506.1 MepB family protein [Vagococcus carniphilus]